MNHPSQALDFRAAKKCPFCKLNNDHLGRVRPTAAAGEKTMSSDREIDAVCSDIASRQRYRRGAKKISTVINHLMTRRGYARVQTASQWQTAWCEAAGKELAKDSRAGNVRRGVLEVFVRNSAVVQELTFGKRRLIKELTRLNPGQKIRDIRFRIGPID